MNCIKIKKKGVIVRVELFKSLIRALIVFSVKYINNNGAPPFEIVQPSIEIKNIGEILYTVIIVRKATNSITLLLFIKLLTTNFALHSLLLYVL